jgi:hypothetical protein
MRPAHKHHYIPKFYTKRWVGSDGLLCQFGLHPRGIAVKRRPADGVGFKENLYSIPGAPLNVSIHLEDKFLRSTDQVAADVAKALIEGRLNALDADQKSGWARFIMSLLQRTPEMIAWLGKVWAGMHAEARAAARAEIEKNNSDLEQLDSLDNSREVSLVRVLQQMMDLPDLGRYIINMRWAVFGLNSHTRLMTSDRPVLITNGLNKPNSQIVLPLSPSHLFVAANSDQVIREIATIHARDLSAQMNDFIVRQAKRYVYAADESQASFVYSRLGSGAAQFIAPDDLLKKYPPD